jgi:hypothetical protein
MKKSFLLLSLAFTSSLMASSVEFKEGWNLVGFPVLQKTEVSSILPIEKVEIIYSYSSSWNSNITHIQPNLGYWVKAKEDFKIEDLTDKAIQAIGALSGKSALSEDIKTPDNWDF